MRSAHPLCWRLALVALALLGGGTSLMGAPEVARSEVSFLSADAFARIGEYFDGVERTPGAWVGRTSPADRAGWYWRGRLRGPLAELPAGGTATLAVVTSTDKTAREASFTLPASWPQGRTLYLGLTGADWPKAGARVLAWRVVVRDLAGNVVLEQKSRLWEFPAGR